MLSTKEIFTRLFPLEQIENETSGYYYLDIKKRNIWLGKFSYSRMFEFQPSRKCNVILGADHILIDGRQVTKTNIKLFLLLIPIAILFSIIYTLITSKLLFLFISLFCSWPIPLLVVFSWVTGVKGGASSYLLDRKWIKEIEMDPAFIIKGTIPGGRPYVLSQYLAVNNINIPELLSGKTAWFGSEYPWKFVETDFSIKVNKEMKYSNMMTYIIFILCVLLILLSVHLTFTILPIQLNQFNSALTAPL